MIMSRRHLDVRVRTRVFYYLSARDFSRTDSVISNSETRPRNILFRNSTSGIISYYITYIIIKNARDLLTRTVRPRSNAKYNDPVVRPGKSLIKIIAMSDSYILQSAIIFRAIYYNVSNYYQINIYYASREFVIFVPP